VKLWLRSMGSDSEEMCLFCFGLVFLGAWFDVVMSRPLSLLLQANRKRAWASPPSLLSTLESSHGSLV
jgi:hypothetical protein